MIIALAGLDGAGKTTIASALRTALSNRGVQTYQVGRWDILNRTQFSCCRFISTDLKELRACVAEMPTSSRMRFLTWAMSLSLEPHLNNQNINSVVVLDSYWFKHAAVEIVYGADPDLISSLVEHLPIPDLVFYLRVVPNISLQRKLCNGDLVPYECGMDSGCSYDAFLTHQSRVATILEAWAKKSAWVQIDASKDINSITREVMHVIAHA